MAADLYQTFHEFLDAYNKLTARQQQWVRNKASLEASTTWAVMKGREVPSEEDLRAGKHGEVYR